MREVFYGCDDQNLYVRIDGAVKGKPGIEFENAAAEVRVATGRIVELSAPRAGRRFRVTVARDGLPPAKVPASGWIELG